MHHIGYKGHIQRATFMGYIKLCVRGSGNSNHIEPFPVHTVYSINVPGMKQC